ncbi:WD40 repeat-like protein [Tuber magnatum]|uniref:WD40 repeat-like protein n=1 Tax=Tuber magnatum TaxID=42249 RepID=A0A317T161_9PEZI|nr:WD40 repeat-like protein [Tuber magnatum]
MADPFNPHCQSHGLTHHHPHHPHTPNFNPSIQPPAPPPPPPPPTPAPAPAVTHGRSSKAVFARLTQPFIGTSRPPSSSGPGSGLHGNLPTKPRTARYTLNSPILALSANVEGDRVVIAGRGILKILRVGYNEITECSVLRVPTEQKKHPQYDVKWGTVHQKNTVATAGTNGTICVYDTKDGRLDRQLREHGRQVHKVAFNPADGRLLLSASQDGTVKLWDLREKKSRLTFVGRADAVRDVQFNAGNAVEFAAAFDNGTIQRWDYRKDSIYERSLSAHNGPAFTVDWHPDGRHCASGGRDRTVKVWDFYADPRQKAKHTISTMTSVSRIAWRPLKQGTTELATCAISNDQRVHVWDLKRPYIPTRIMDEHECAVTGILWKDEDVLWSCSKDNTFVQNDVNLASRPINSLAHGAFSWSPTGSFTFVVEQRKSRRSASRGFDSEDDLAGHDRRRHGRGSSFRGSKPTLGSPETLDKIFVPSQASASVHMPGIFDEVSFPYFAQNYLFDLEGVMGGPKISLGEACEANARTAWMMQKYRTAQTWKVLQLALVREEKAIERRHEVNAAGFPSATGAAGGLTMRRQGLAATEQGNSGGATPLAGPTHVGPSRSIVTPTLGRPGGAVDALLLPPPAFGTSLGSSTTSTDGEEYTGAHANDCGMEDAKHRPMLDITADDGAEEVKPTLVDSYNGTANTTTANVNNNHTTSATTTATSSAKGEDRSIDSLSLFTQRTDYSPAVHIPPTPPIPMHQPAGSPAVHMPQSGQYSSSASSNVGKRRERLYSLTSETTTVSSSPYGDFHNRVSEDDDESTSPKTGTWMEAIVEEPPLPPPPPPQQPAATPPSIHLPPSTKHRAGQAAQGEEDQTFPLHPLPLVASISSYLDLLRRFNLHSVAASVIKCAQVLPEFTALGQTNTHLDFSCGRCARPITTTATTTAATAATVRVGAGGGGVGCGKCGAVDGCVICWGKVGRWSMCQGCGHGGHDECLREWFFGGGTGGECAAVGCGHYCLPG